jgi:ABC-type multidrug transport system ATPase subunit
MIGVTNLTPRYGKFTAVIRMSFQIGCGARFGLLGHISVCKSTTEQVLTDYSELASEESRIVLEALQVDR